MTFQVLRVPAGPSSRPSQDVSVLERQHHRGLFLMVHFLCFPNVFVKESINPYRCSSGSEESCYLFKSQVSINRSFSPSSTYSFSSLPPPPPVFPNLARERTGHDLDLGNTVRVTENDTNLRGSRALLGELADLVDDLLGGGLEPRRRGARVGERGGRNALSVAVKTTHVWRLVLVSRGTDGFVEEILAGRS